MARSLGPGHPGSSSLGRSCYGEVSRTKRKTSERSAVVWQQLVHGANAETKHALERLHPVAHRMYLEGTDLFTFEVSSSFQPPWRATTGGGRTRIGRVGACNGASPLLVPNTGRVPGPSPTQGRWSRWSNVVRFGSIMALDQTEVIVDVPYTNPQDQSREAI